MEKNKQPGVQIASVNLLNSCVNFRSSSVDLEFSLGIDSIDRKIINDQEMRAIITFNLMKGILEPAFTFTATYGICYTRDPAAPMTWDDLNNGFILTHVLPYFREFASSVTLRLPVPALIIPPTNVNVLLREYEAGSSEE